MTTAAEHLRRTAEGLADGFLKDSTNVGIAIGVIAAGERFTFGYGKLTRDSDRVPDGHTVFEIASVTKTFTAALLAEMVARGEVAFDQPVQELLPREVSVPTYRGKPITLAHLAEHTSSLPRLPDNLGATITDPANPYKGYEVRHLYEWLNSARLQFPPGSGVLYSNLGMGLLGHALALRAARSFEKLMTDRILLPLGMTDTAVTLTDGQIARMAQGHDECGKPTSNWDTPALHGAGALRSSVSELLTYLQANLTPADTPLRGALECCHTDRPLAWWRRVPVGANVAVASAAASLLLQWLVPIPPGRFSFLAAMLLPVLICLFWKGFWAGVVSASFLWVGSLILWRDGFGWGPAAACYLVLLWTAAKLAGYVHIRRRHPSRYSGRVRFAAPVAAAALSLVLQWAVPVPPGSLAFLLTLFLPVALSFIALGLWPGVLAAVAVWAGTFALWGQNFGWQPAGLFFLIFFACVPPNTGCSPTNRAMLGWQETWTEDGDKVWWHNGGTGGFASFVAFTHNPNVAVAVLANSAKSVDRLGGDMLEYARRVTKGIGSNDA